ncbi:MAG: tRNA pseudouridine(38-40) synthase TruA, partial [Gammaproteobacteria bacterium]|nr:tRNA pseudouridine(38-40) synthase TruA [Gammaproteobacteria bacterium]
MSPPNERRIKLTLHYDGSGFHGWQVQPGVRTVQAELEAALSRLTDRPTPVVGAGRTDRGVHATGQVASALV